MAKLAIKTAILLVLFVFNPSTGFPQDGRLSNRLDRSWVKAENGLIINFKRGILSDMPSSEIRICDNKGQPLVNFTILRLVPDAVSVSIYDVSAVKGEMVAVSAVYVKSEYQEPSAILLVFDFKGKLESATAVDDKRLLLLLEIDNQSRIWALTGGAGGNDPTKTPVVLEFDKAGSEIGRVLTWDKFPSHSDGIRQNQALGPAAAGYNSGSFWFWLPGSTDLVEIQTKDGSVLGQLQTSVPQVQDQSVFPLAMVHLSSGELVGAFGAVGHEVNAKAQLTNFVWSPRTRTWSLFDVQSCQDYRLIGGDGDKPVYFRFDNSNAICNRD